MESWGRNWWSGLIGVLLEGQKGGVDRAAHPAYPAHLPTHNTPPQSPDLPELTSRPVRVKRYLSWWRCFHLRKYLGASSCRGVGSSNRGQQGGVQSAQQGRSLQP